MKRHRPRRRFGQNFLHDPGVIARMIGAIAPQANDTMIEIGPGQAALTAPLRRRVERLQVIEIDRDLAAALGDQGGDGLVVHRGDALKTDFRALSSAPGRLRVVGNLPYNISTPLLFHLLDQIECLRDMHFLLQREVVTRMAAGPGGRDYGRLSVMIQRCCRVEALFDVAPGAFRPAPRVVSTFVRLVPHAVPPIRPHDPRAFAEVVALAFGGRRKTLRNALRSHLDAEAIRAAGVDPGARAEQLELEQFARLADRLSGV